MPVPLLLVLLLAQSLADGLAKMQSNDFAGAAKILETVTAREPGNGRAWRNLALAYEQLKEPVRAIEAYRHSLAVQPAMPGPLFQIARLYAGMGDSERAIEWLSQAKASHKIDLTQVEAAAEFATLKNDPRVKALLPKPSDFANPFLEPVKILREWQGESANDQFGWIARSIGDVDGDGIPDFVTSAPTKSIGGANAGRIYVYSTKSGKLLWSADGHPGDQLGQGIEGAGDTNRDGIPDVIASAPGAGKAYVYSGRDGRVLLTLSAEDPADGFGRHVDGAGDVDHDGYADVLIGAPGNHANTGAAYVYSGRDGKLLLRLAGERAGDNFGSAVAAFKGKGSTFLLAGAPKAGAARTGRVYVYGDLTGKPRFTIDPEESGQALGAMFLSVPGDLDGDGVPDVFASDWSDKAKGPSTGRIYVHSGKDGRRLFTLTGDTPAEGFGTSASMAGDVDGDGIPDLIIGAWQFAQEAQSGGRAYLHSGRTGQRLATYTCRIPGDTFGFDAVGMGDVDGDGAVDFLITSAWSGIHGFHSGRMFIISSGIPKSTSGVGFQPGGPQTGS